MLLSRRMGNNQSVEVKWEHGDVLRHFTVPVRGGYTTLTSKIKECDPNFEGLLLWTDEEGDAISLSTDMEFEEAALLPINQPLFNLFTPIEDPTDAKTRSLGRTFRSLLKHMRIDLNNEMGKVDSKAFSKPKVEEDDEEREEEAARCRKNLWNIVEKFVRKFVAAVATYLKWLFSDSEVSEIVCDVARALLDFFKSLFRTIYNALRAIFCAVTNFFSNVFNRISSFLSQVAGLITNFFSSFCHRNQHCHLE